MRSVTALLCGAAIAASAARAAEPLAAPNLPAADTWVPTGGGAIRVLDKQKAQSQLLQVKLGQTVRFETLSITLRACMVHPPVLPPDEAGFLEVTDSREGEPGFHGWMLSHESGLAMLESPVYGVRVTGCDTPTDEAIAAAMPQAASAPALNPAPPAPGAAPNGTAPAPAAVAVPLSPEPSQPLTAAPPPQGAVPPGYIPAPPASLAPARPASPAAPAQPAAPASGGLY